MKLKILIHRIREDFLDDTNRPELWDETAVFNALNATVDDLCGLINLIKDDRTYTTAVTASGYVGYSPLSSRITHINDVWYTTATATTVLTLKKYAELQTETPTWRTTSASTPKNYLTDVEANYIYIYPKPDTDGSIGMNVWRTWTKSYTPDDVNEMVGTPPAASPIEVPDLKHIYHEKLIPGVLMKLYEKQDSEIFDEQLQAKYKAEWLENIEFIRRAELKFHYRDLVNSPSMAFT